MMAVWRLELSLKYQLSNDKCNFDLAIKEIGLIQATRSLMLIFSGDIIVK